MYYAIEHTYGANVRDSDGDMIGRIEAFARRRDRDTWVDEGPAYFTSPGAREAIPSSHRHVRRFKAGLAQARQPLTPTTPETNYERWQGDQELRDYLDEEGTTVRPQALL